MAKQQTDTTSLNFTVQLKTKHIPELADMMQGNGLTDEQKIRDMAEQLLTQQATGGFMLSPEEVARIEASTGAALASAEDLIPFLAEQTAMEEGMHVIKVRIDPAYFSAYEEIAESRETTPQALLQEVTDQVIRDGWVEEIRPYPRHVIMSEKDAAEIEELLGAKFTTGTDLARVIREFLAPPDMFSEDKPQEVTQ